MSSHFDADLVIAEDGGKTRGRWNQTGVPEDEGRQDERKMETDKGGWEQEHGDGVGSEELVIQNVTKRRRGTGQSSKRKRNSFGARGRCNGVTVY